MMTIKAAIEELSADELRQVSGGKFEIQHLMSAYNQAETLASSTMKKADATASSVIGKI